MPRSRLPSALRSRVRSLLQTQLFELGADDELAVGLALVEAVIVLVVVLGLVEGAGAGDLGDDGRGEVLRGLALRSLRGFPLSFRMVEDRRAVLRADVMALPVERGRIVELPEALEEL